MQRSIELSEDDPPPAETEARKHSELSSASKHAHTKKSRRARQAPSGVAVGWSGYHGYQSWYTDGSGRWTQRTDEQVVGGDPGINQRRLPPSIAWVTGTSGPLPPGAPVPPGLHEAVTKLLGASVQPVNPALPGAEVIQVPTIGAAGVPVQQPWQVGSAAQPVPDVAAVDAVAPVPEESSPDIARPPRSHKKQAPEDNKAGGEGKLVLSFKQAVPPKDEDEDKKEESRWWSAWRLLPVRRSFATAAVRGHLA